MTVGCARLGPQMGRGQEGVGQLVQRAGRHAPRLAFGSALGAPEQVFFIGRQLEPGVLKFFRFFPGLETLIAPAVRPEIDPGELPVRFAATGAENDGHSFLLFRRFRLRARKKQRCAESARYCSRQGEAGAYNEPGVPDITGGVHTGGGSNDGFTGAFYGQDISLITGQHPSSAAINSSNFFFAASRASHVYGASDTVMPPSVDLPVALYLGSSTEV